MSRVSIEIYKGTEVMFDTESTDFVCMPPGCKKERTASTMWQMRMEVDAAIKRQNQPKRKRARHQLRWWDEENGCAKEETFVGVRAPENGDRGAFFKNEIGATYHRTSDWRETKLRVIPTDVRPDEIVELMRLHCAFTKAKKEYDNFMTQNTRVARIPSLPWQADVEELNKLDERFVEHLEECAKPREAQS